MVATNALTTREILPPAQDWRTMREMAADLVDSGMLPTHIKTPQAAIAIMLKGREIGIPAMQAMSSIAFIQGKPTPNAELMLALIYRDHGDGAVRFTETSPTRAEVQYKRRGWSAYETFAFSIQDAERAALTTGNNAATWKKYPQAMLRARCISALARLAFPDTIGGMYLPEELGADVTVTADGAVEVIEARTVDADGVIHESATGVRLPWGVTPEQWANFHALATGKGVAVDPTMTPDEIAGAIRRAGGPAIPGKITPGNAWEALKRLPEQVHTETDVSAPLDESPIEGESREDDDTFSDEAMAETARRSEAARQRGLGN